MDVQALKGADMKWIKDVRDKFPADDYWMERVNEIKVGIKELWVTLAENRSSAPAIIQKITDQRNELDKCLRAMGILTTQVNPESLITDTIRIVHEYPEDQE